MTVKELIAALQKCPPDAQVVAWQSWDTQFPVKTVSPEGADGEVVLGEDLPPELYGRDYKYD